MKINAPPTNILMLQATYSSNISSDNSSFIISSTSQPATTFDVLSNHFTTNCRTTFNENITDNIEQILAQMQHIELLKATQVDDDISLPINFIYTTLQPVEFITPFYSL